MKVVLLAGGFGTRISEDSHLKPKPMIEIGDNPILWHIMKIFSAFGYHEFIICLGYKGYKIKEYFADYYLHTSDVAFDMKNNTMEVHNNYSEPWHVTLVNTGLNTMTGGRIRRVRDYINDDDFMVTYGDGVANININELEQFHRSHGLTATLTAVQPVGRFGVLDIDQQCNITQFAEKKQQDVGWINGGFMVFSNKIWQYLEDDTTILERNPLESLSAQGELKAFMHHGYWQCMDTLRDRMHLEDLWESGKAPWKVW